MKKLESSSLYVYLANKADSDSYQCISLLTIHKLYLSMHFTNGNGVYHNILVLTVITLVYVLYLNTDSLKPSLSMHLTAG